MTKRSDDKACEHCGKMFHPDRRSSRFCSGTCAAQARYKAHSREAKCAQCGAAFVSRRGKRNEAGERCWTRYCGMSCSGKAHSTGGNTASHRRCRYGMEPEEYERLLRLQKGACALCRKTPKYPLYVDHHHGTRKNRSLLCARCNHAVGVFEALSWDEVLVYWGYTHFHDEGVALATAAAGRAGEGPFDSARASALGLQQLHRGEPGWVK